MKLPTAFIEKYRQLLGNEADAFLAAFDQPSCSGFRTNPLKNGQPDATLKTASGKIEYVENGWFRKEPAGIEYWTPDYPSECANRQRKILSSAMKMLKPGGTLVYSTCTFAPEEDEQNAAWLLDNYDLTMEPIKKYVGMDDGRPEWADGNPELSRAVRLFPHHIQGEGHFIAKFRLQGTLLTSVSAKKKSKKKGKPRANHNSITKGHVCGWGKLVGQTLKNFYPKGLRF